MSEKQSEILSRTPLKAHWEHVYAHKASMEVSWFQVYAKTSMNLIQYSGLSPAASIIDVGGGDSVLVNDLLDAGYVDVTVLDLSRVALSRARQRLGGCAHRVNWVEGDVNDICLPRDGWDIWHDRAVFHFLTSVEGRRAYIAQLRCALRPGGYAVIATFAEDGPERCSGLPVRRYGHEDLAAELGGAFRLLQVDRELHETPSGDRQSFIYCLFRHEARLHEHPP